MKSAQDWFQEGMQALDLARGADHHWELREDSQRAAAAFEQALGLDPAHRGALRHRALTLADLEEDEAAIDALIVAVSLEPEDASLRSKVASCLLRLDQPDAAVGAFDKLLRLSPGDPQALFGRATALTTLGRDEEALAAWEAVSALHDFRHASAALSRACALARLGRTEARQAFAVAFQRDPHPPEVHEALRSFEAARAAFEDYAVQPLSARALRQVGHAWRVIGRLEEAAAIWAELVRVDPADTAAWFDKGQVHLERGELREAIAAYEQSLRLWPESRNTAERLAEARRKLSAQQEAP